MKNRNLIFAVLIGILFFTSVNFIAKADISSENFKVTYSSELNGSNQVELPQRFDCTTDPSCECIIWQVTTSPTNCFCMTTDQENKFACPDNCCNDGMPIPVEN